MLILNLYTYKGPKTSLIGPWVSAAYLYDTSSDNKNFSIQYKHIFTYRNNMSKFNYLINNNLDIKIIESIDINIYNTYLLYKIENNFISYAKAISKIKKEKLIINKVKNAKEGYEKIPMLYAIYYRNMYLKKVSTYFNIEKLEASYKEHLDMLCNYKYLPPIYIWNKCVKAVKFIYPKPYWYNTELKALYEYN